MIRFAFKTAVFLVFLLVAISFFGPSSQKSSHENTANSVNTFDAIGAVKNTVQDIGGFCDRNAETCEKGKSILGSIGERVRDGAKITYEYLDSKLAKDEKADAGTENIKTGSIPADGQNHP